MSVERILLRFHPSRERERRAWEILLRFKQQEGCTYNDVITAALLAYEEQANEISSTQEDRIVTRIVEAVTAIHPQKASESTALAHNEKVEKVLSAPDGESFEDVDWGFLGG